MIAEMMVKLLNSGKIRGNSGINTRTKTLVLASLSLILTRGLYIPLSHPCAYPPRGGDRPTSLYIWCLPGFEKTKSALLETHPC